MNHVDEIDFFRHIDRGDIAICKENDYFLNTTAMGAQSMF